MQRIAVVTMGVKLAFETKGYDRFKYLAALLTCKGYEVDLITSSFQHWEKKQRDTADPAYQEGPFRVVFIEEPGYKKNLDLDRIHSHQVAAMRLADYFAQNDVYDLVYAEIPPNDVAKACALYAERAGIPFICDVNDLWPEAMRMALDVPLVSDVAFHPFAADAKEVYKRVAAVVGTSDEYAARPLQDRAEPCPTRTVYVGNELAVFDAGVAEHAAGIEKPVDEFWVAYAGTLGASYDIRTMIDASALLRAQGASDVRMMILGGGPDEEVLKEHAASLDCNVDFVGYQPYDKMAAYLSASDVLVNSFVRKAPQSIVTKIGDYLAAGKPMINTCVSPEFRAKVEADGFGVNIEPEDAQVLADAVLALKADPETRAVMGKRARVIAEEQFDRPASYEAITDLIAETLADFAAKRGTAEENE